MNLAITGGNGFIGKIITPLLSQDYFVTPIGQNDRVDITNKKAVDAAIAESSADVILHLAAYTNVDEAEKQKELGAESLAMQINAGGTENVAQAAKRHGKWLIYISTDMVFGGEYEEEYHENTHPSPVNFYGYTKYEGEKRALDTGGKTTILRIAYPYTWRAEKMDFIRVFLKYLAKGEAFSSVSDAHFTPTYIPDIATIVHFVIEHNSTGIIHGSSGEKLSGYEAALQIADKFGFDKNLVSPTTRAEFFKDRAPRSKNTSLYNDTLHKENVHLHTLDESLNEAPQELLTLSG